MTFSSKVRQEGGWLSQGTVAGSARGLVRWTTPLAHPASPSNREYGRYYSSITRKRINGCSPALPDCLQFSLGTRSLSNHRLSLDMKFGEKYLLSTWRQLPALTEFILATSSTKRAPRSEPARDRAASSTTTCPTQEAAR